MVYLTKDIEQWIITRLGTGKFLANMNDYQAFEEILIRRQAEIQSNPLNIQHILEQTLQ